MKTKLMRVIVKDGRQCERLPGVMREEPWKPAKSKLCVFFFFNNQEVIWMICTSICHLASHSNHPYLVLTGLHN